MQTIVVFGSGVVVTLGIIDLRKSLLFIRTPKTYSNIIIQSSKPSSLKFYMKLNWFV